MEAPSAKLPISPKVGEMSGRTEGGAKDRDAPGLHGHARSTDAALPTQQRTRKKHFKRTHPMSSRYATIITDDDGREVVSCIGEFVGGAPDVRVGRVERVPPGVLIGMVRAIDAATGFGFPAGSPGADGRAVGIAAANPHAPLQPPAADFPAPAASSSTTTPEPARPAGSDHG
jgi:hypothetical protein